jgi:cyclase
MSSIIIAHENVRSRLVGSDSASSALPVITYDDDVSVHFNGEEITLIHMPAGHTDTDSIVLFAESNVVHMGDHFFNGSFPFVDLASGGTVQGYINNLEKAMAWIEEDTRVIPGHGPLASKADLLAFYNVVKDSTTDIRVMKSQRMTLEEIVAQGLDARYESWGSGFINEQRWIETVFNSYPR